MVVAESVLSAPSCPPPGAKPATGGVCQSTVPSVTTDWLPSMTWIWPLPAGGDRDLAVLAEVVEDLVAAVEQVVGALPGLDGRADRLVELREAGGGRLDRARGPGEVVELGGGVGAGLLDLSARLPMASASVLAAVFTACLELSDSGWLARSVQAE